MTTLLLAFRFEIDQFGTGTSIARQTYLHSEFMLHIS